MQKVFVSLFVSVILYSAAHAQDKVAAIDKTKDFADLGFGFGSSQGSVSASYIHNWHLGKKRKIVIGTGARFTTYFGKNIDFLSAPPSLAGDEKSTDTLFAPKPSISALNVLINLGYNLSPKLQVGFNIDAIGFSFGPNGSPTFTGNGNTINTKAKPTGFNVLLGGNNDRGNLNSQFYLQYLFGKKWGAKVAYQYLFTELTTDTKVQAQPELNDRFRNKASMGYAGVTYSF
ncbi:hypothetical protein BH10BAC2_BH10BAC2_49450 [soil metagenome]